MRRRPVRAVGVDVQPHLEPRVLDGAGRAWLYVEPDGDVLRSQGMPGKILGNILRDNWETIYRPES